MSSLAFNGELTLSTQVQDLDAAIAWYTDVLGLNLLYKVEEIAWAELASPVVKVNIGLSQVESPKVAAGPVPTWGVDDVDAARLELESKGVRFDGDTQTIPGMVKLATFFDPDGNAYMLFQSLGEM